MEQILSKLPSSQLHLGTAVHSIVPITRHKSGNSTSGHDVQVKVNTAFEKSVSYDHVILACHSDTALTLLRAGGCATADEERILSAIDWRRNRAILHYDEQVSLQGSDARDVMMLICQPWFQLMPKHRSAWSCWNYLTSSETSTNAENLESRPNGGNASVYVFFPFCCYENSSCLSS